MLGRAAATRGTFAAATYGRGLSTAARASGTSLRQVSPIKIIGPDGRIVSQTVRGSNGQIVKVRGSDLFYSKEGRNHDTHYNQRGVTGYSYRYDDRVTEHRDQSRRTFGFDEYVRGTRLIRHFDRLQRQIGETYLEDDKGSYRMQSSEEFEMYMALVDPEGITMCPAAQAEYDRFLELKRQCGQGSSSACNEQRWSQARMKAEQSKCKKAT